MPSSYILALDQGTTSSRSILFDDHGNIHTVSQREFKQFYPQPGWVEHDADEIWNTQLATIAAVVAESGISAGEIAAIGITNQRETTVVWDRTTGKPVYHAIVWQDRRTSEYCDKLKESVYASGIQSTTGLIIDSYFSATKVQWILENVLGARDKANKGELAFGTIDSWLIWNLTEGALHITDVSNASRTMLFDIATCQWNEELLELFNIPKSMLPDVRSSSEVYGTTGKIMQGARIPIAGIAGDQQAALFGQMCINPGMVKNTYGTGCFMLMNTGENIIRSRNSLLTTIAWRIGNKTEYALEGSVFMGGAVVQWLRNGLKIIKTSREIETLARKVDDTVGVYVVPAFAGLGAPYWNQQARGSIFGLTRGTTNAHLALAVLESIAYQTYDVLKAMEADAGIRITELRVDGGATINNRLMQFQSDILRTEVIRTKIAETTALGAAYLAGLAVGYWESVENIQQQWQIDHRFVPSMEDETRNQLLHGWRRAVNATIAWADSA